MPKIFIWNSIARGSAPGNGLWMNALRGNQPHKDAIIYAHPAR
jgi:hypothetical protein